MFGDHHWKNEQTVCLFLRSGCTGGIAFAFRPLPQVCQSLSDLRARYRAFSRKKTEENIIRGLDFLKSFEQFLGSFQGSKLPGMERDTRFHWFSYVFLPMFGGCTPPVARKRGMSKVGKTGTGNCGLWPCATSSVSGPVKMPPPRKEQEKHRATKHQFVGSFEASN